MSRIGRIGFSFLVVAAALGIAGSARAQNIDEALRLYKSKSFAQAAFAFYDVMAHDSNADVREQAQIYLAETLRKQDILIPAMFYYQRIIADAGKQSRYYLNAVEGLLAVQKELREPLFIPNFVNVNFDPEGFGQLDPERIAHVNYLVGEISFRRRKNQDAASFLEFVPPESPYHVKARYLLGILAIRQGKAEAALPHFRAVVEQIEEDDSNPERRHLRNLALLATGRASYGLGRFGEAARYYSEVPRYSEEWFSAMYEDSWTQFQLGEFGRALGDLTSVTSPFFAKRHVPEAYVVQATAYFSYCQWDRVREAVGRYKKVYEPMLQGLKAYLEASREAPEFYADVVAGGGGRFSVELARDVRRSQRFRDFYYVIEHMKWELAEVKRQKTWKGSRLGDDLADIVVQHQEQLENAVGQWVKVQLTKRFNNLQNFQNQVDILDFEVTDAERQWLEQGKEVLKGRRARLPRPEIPTDQWQHWDFDKEYWKDEVGYIQHSMACECLTREECESFKAATN